MMKSTVAMNGSRSKHKNTQTKKKREQIGSSNNKR